jgi:bifunctional NMN adenylyltransferase/nudix hydrolase
MQILTKKFDVGVIIGRFQVDALHDGHIEMLSHVQSKHDRVVVFLGIPAMQYGSLNNPLDFQSRQQMIQEKFPQFIILPLQDRRSDKAWSDTIDSLISNIIIPKQSVVLYGARDSFIPYYKGKYSVIELETENNKFLSGTEVRNRIKNTTKLDESFRRGAIWQTFNRYNNCFTTVDVAILNDKEEVLLAKKPDEHGWRFVGGFAETSSFSFEDDAIREVKEETGVEVDRPKYIASCVINDWRLTKEKDKIKTLFFKCKYLFGSPKANDDICELSWINLKAPKIIMMPEHVGLMQILFDNLFTKE